MANNDDVEGKSIHDIILTKEEGLQDKLFVDALPRFSFQDHFLPDIEQESDFYKGSLTEQGDFHKVRFSTELAEGRLQLTGEGLVNHLAFQVQKTITLKDDEIKLAVTILNQSSETYIGYYGVEFNFGLLGGASPDRYYELPEKDRTGDITNRQNKALRSLIIESAWVAVRTDPALLLAFRELTKRMKPTKAIIRIAKKLVNRIRYVLKNQQKYEHAVVK
jgi:hypothetical protein